MTIILARMGWSILLYVLQKTGVVNAVEAAGIKAGTHVLQAVENTKVYPGMPSEDQKGQPSFS